MNRCESDISPTGEYGMDRRGSKLAFSLALFGSAARTHVLRAVRQDRETYLPPIHPEPFQSTQDSHPGISEGSGKERSSRLSEAHDRRLDPQGRRLFPKGDSRWNCFPGSPTGTGTRLQARCHRIVVDSLSTSKP